jgi:hypothetical protein
VIVRGCVPDRLQTRFPDWFGTSTRTPFDTYVFA